MDVPITMTPYLIDSSDVFGVEWRDIKKGDIFLCGANSFSKLDLYHFYICHGDYSEEINEIDVNTNDVTSLVIQKYNKLKIFLRKNKIKQLLNGNV